MLAAQKETPTQLKGSGGAELDHLMSPIGVEKLKRKTTGVLLFIRLKAR